MSFPRLIFTAIWWFMLAAGATDLFAADPSPESIPELRGKLIENYSESVNTSGVLLVGLAFGNVGDQIVPSDVRIRLPENLVSRTLCLSIVSQDGVYSGRAKMTRPGRSSGMYRLQPFDETAHRGLIASATNENLAVRVAAKNKCGGERERALIPAILSPTYSSLLVLLNSRGALVTEVTLEQESRVLRADCKRTNNQRSTAYDTVCNINIERLPKSGLRSLKIEKIPRSGPRRTFVYGVYI